MYQFFVGIDVSKSWIDASWSDHSAPCYLGQFPNSIEGFKKLISALQKATKAAKTSWFICFENTGTYSKLLLQWLCSQQIACREENAIRISKEAGLRRGKSDKIDSGIICLYAFKNRDLLKPTELPTPVIEQMKKLLSRRNFLVRQRTARKVSLNEQKNEYPPDLLKALEAQDREAIKLLDQDIQFVEDKIKELIASNKQIEKNSRLTQSVKGIGPVITWYLIASTNNFQNFCNARKFASYCGIAPFPHSSGSAWKGKNKVSHLANKQIKALLSNGVQAAIQHDTELRTYFARKIGEGKEEGVVLNAVKNKLIARAFAVVQRGTPFISTHNYA